MKGRLKSTIWSIVIVNVAAFVAVLVLAYAAGAHGGVSILDLNMMSSAAFGRLALAGFVILIAAVMNVIWLGSAVVKPVQKLTEFSERLANGDYKSKAEIESSDDFGYI